MSLKPKTVAPTKKSITPKSKTSRTNDEVVAILKKVSFADKDDKTIKFFTDSQIENLVQIRVASDNEFLLSIKHPYYLYEIIGGFYKLRKATNSDTVIDNCITFLGNLSQEPSFSLFDDDLTILFRVPWYDKERQLYKETLDRMKTKISIKKGILECHKCKSAQRPSYNTESVEFQTRSSDEPMTVVTTCNECGNKWWV